MPKEIKIDQPEEPTQTEELQIAAELMRDLAKEINNPTEETPIDIASQKAAEDKK